MDQIYILNYLDVISTFAPDAEVVCYGDPKVYSNIVWKNGTPLPTQAELDTIILQQAKLDQVKALSDACQKQITLGFRSNALGNVNVYDSEYDDQINIIGSVSTISPTPTAPEGYTTPYAIRPVNADGSLSPKTYAIHTYAQLKQVMTDGTQYKLSCLLKFNTKRDYVNNNCDTIEKILAVTWDSVES